MIYYLETNIIAIVVGAILLAQAKKASSGNETSQIFVRIMLRLLIILSVSDIAAYCFRGKSAAGVQFSNIVYFITMALGDYAWFIFVGVKTEHIKNLRRSMLLTGGPVLILCLMIAANPLTGFFFTVDSELLYHRGAGVPLSWVIEWGYMFTALALNIRAILSEQRAFRRSEYCGYLVFALPMAAAAVCQMLFYGTTTTQIGFMIALLMVYINKQHYQVQRDELTGLSNRNAFLNYRDSMVSRSRPMNLTFIMMDADEFKAINDTYGHLKGDTALRDIAEALKDASGILPQSRLILYRYAGDEFVIIGIGINDEQTQMLTDSIENRLELTNVHNADRGERYRLSLSIGISCGTCQSMREFDMLFRAADENMYKVKKSKKHR